MSSRIRFRVHNQEYPGDTFLNEAFDQSQFTSASDALLAIMSMVSVFDPSVIQEYDPIQLAIQNSENDLQLRRRDDIVIDVDSQSYDTTDKKYEECSICTDKYEKKDEVSVLDCGHVYHSKCIKEWGKYKTSCPVCISKISFRYSNAEEVD